MLSKRYAALDFNAPLSPFADDLLAAAVAEFDEKQFRLQTDWRFERHVRSEYDPATAILRLDFVDGTRLQADGQLLGTFRNSDSSFEWAWNNPRFPTSIAADSLRIRSKGDGLGLTYLRAGLVPIEEPRFLSFLCAVAIKIVDADGVFRGGGDVQTLIAVRNLKWIEQ